MKLLNCALVGVLALVSPLWSQARETDTVLSTAVRLRLNSIAPVVIDPAVLDLKMLTSQISVEATNRASAVSQLKKALEPKGLVVVEQGDDVWITSREVETDLSRQIAVIVNTADYTRLAGLLSAESKRSQDPRLGRLAEMATFMARQSELPLKTRNFIQEKSQKIRSLQYMQKNALSGSSLSPPDPKRAASLELDIEKQRDEVRRYFDQIQDQFIASNFDPSTPESAPPIIFAVANILPPVVFQRIAFDSQLFFVESMEVLLRASTELAFDGENDRKSAAKLRSDIDRIRKQQATYKVLLAEYIELLQRAGLLSGGTPPPPATVKSALGVDAANKLFNDFGDRREAVRLAIGRHIMAQFEAVAEQLSGGQPSALQVSELYLYGEKEIANAGAEFGQQVKFQPYAAGRHERVGAVTGLVVKGNTIGEISTYSIQLEPRAKSGASAERSLQNIFGSKEEVVAINTTADLANVDGLFLGKGGAYAGEPDPDDPGAVEAWMGRLFGGDGTIASVGEALNLIKAQYDPSIFKSKVVLGFDSNFQIRYGGDSAGVAIALAALSRIKSKGVDSRLMVTGAVRQFGDVRRVGSVYLKGKAALEAGALALLVPVEVLDELLNLPTDKILTRHVITLSRFRDAASIACLDVTPESRSALQAICLYNFALTALKAGKLHDAASLSQDAVNAYPDHISAQLLRMLLSAAGFGHAASASNSALPDQAQAFANIFVTNPIAIRDGSTANIPEGSGSLMATIIPEYAVSNASGEEAFDVLNDKAKIAYGRSANITIRTKNEFFTNQFINLNLQGKTFEEILTELCELCDAKFEKKTNAIVVDSVQSPVALELANIVIPNFTVEDMNGEDAFKYLADRAAEVSGKRPNFVIKSRPDFFSQLSINLTLQNQTFKEILKQLCEVCNAKVEQRGDSYFVTVTN